MKRIKNINIYIDIKNVILNDTKRKALCSLYSHIGDIEYNDSEKCIRISNLREKYINNLTTEELNKQISDNIDILSIYGIRFKHISQNIHYTYEDGGVEYSHVTNCNLIISGSCESNAPFIDWVSILILLKREESILIPELLEYIQDDVNNYNNLYKALELMANNYSSYVTGYKKGFDGFINYCMDINPNKFKQNIKLDLAKGEASIRNIKSWLNNKNNKNSRHSRYNNENKFKEDINEVSYTYTYMKQIVDELVFNLFLPILYWYYFEKKVENLNLGPYESIYHKVKSKRLNK